MLRSLVAISVLISTVPSVAACHGLSLPHEAVIVRPFAPVGRFGGHWGVDVAAAPGSDVRAIGAGTVSFAGSVAGRRSVTIDHGGGLRTSYSYLAGISAEVGRTVAPGSPIGTAGVHDGTSAFHLSLRIGTTYVDPLVLGWCSDVPEPALWLATASHEYPVVRDRN
ncbi:MAG: M23 family metallopeptidase, partial [Actinomycetota bacterium]